MTETVAFDPTSQGSLADSWTINANDGLGRGRDLPRYRSVSAHPDGIGQLAQLGPPELGTATATFTLSLSWPSPTR